MSQIDTAVILAAGAGTRLRMAAESKPLCVVAGKTLLDHALERLAEAGIASWSAMLLVGAISVPLVFALTTIFWRRRSHSRIG